VDVLIRRFGSKECERQLVAEFRDADYEPLVGDRCKVPFIFGASCSACFGATLAVIRPGR
jgi:hypothetical protein